MEIVKSDVNSLDIFSNLCDQTACNLTKKWNIIFLTTLIIPLRIFFLALNLHTSTAVLM